ncbi:MAG: hypothetical protein RLZZ362_940 [Actinomycetota bacterium]
MTPHRKKIVGAIASAVAALTLLGGTAAAADAAPRHVKPTPNGPSTSKPSSGVITAKAWKPR